MPKVCRNRSPGNKSRQATTSRGHTLHPFRQAGDQPQPSTASRIIGGQASGQEMHAAPKTRRNRRGELLRSDGTPPTVVRSSAYPKRRKRGQRRPTMCCLAKAPPYMKDSVEKDIRKGSSLFLSYIDVPRLSGRTRGLRPTIHRLSSLFLPPPPPTNGIDSTSNR